MITVPSSKHNLNKKNLKYETKIQAGEFIILVTGTNEDVTQAKQMLDKISHGISMSVAA
jgi:hypothetical protein